MYVLTHREPAFPETPLPKVIERAAEYLDRHLDGYEFVAQRPVDVLEPEDTRRGYDAVRHDEHGRHISHAARRIEGGWELYLVISGD